jgi:DNA polymerase-3 subunit epsilon
VSGLLRTMLPWLDTRLSAPPARGRWVVVDVETSGLNPSTDSLISIGALAVNDGAIDLADSFEVVLRQDVASDARNIEVHGIAAGEQMAGEDPAIALRAFLAFVRDDPLVAFHAPFDRAVLARALRERLRVAFHRHWLDLADVAPLAWPQQAGRRSLDSWLEVLAIPVAFRHRAIADCLATGQLFLAVLAQASLLEARTARDLLALSGARRWMPAPRG